MIHFYGASVDASVGLIGLFGIARRRGAALRDLFSSFVVAKVVFLLELHYVVGTGIQDGLD